jgi:hypothetical protein
MASKIQVERMEALEKRLGVSLNRIGVKAINEDNFEVHFELKILDGGKLLESIGVITLIYDGSGGLLGREEYCFDADKVFAFSSGSAYFSSLPFYDVKKIVIYPETF